MMLPPVAAKLFFKLFNHIRQNEFVAHGIGENGRPRNGPNSAWVFAGIAMQ
jgi:hypothetical protein